MKNVQSNAKERALCKVLTKDDEANRVQHLQGNRQNVLRAAAELLGLTLYGTKQTVFIWTTGK